MAESPRTVRNVLGVFPFGQSPLPAGYVAGSEVDGFVIYSLWPNPVSKEQASAVLSISVAGWQLPDVEVKGTNLSGDNYGEFVIYVRVFRYPSAADWLNLVGRNLKAIVDLGAAVAWIGPDWGVMENVYAAYSSETGFVCRSGLDDAIVYLTEKDLEKLTGVLDQRGILKELPD